MTVDIQAKDTTYSKGPKGVMSLRSFFFPKTKKIRPVQVNTVLIDTMDSVERAPQLKEVSPPLKEEWQIDLQKVFIGPEFAGGSSGNLHHGIYEGKPVAVKLFRKVTEAKEVRRISREFQQEVAVLSQWRHPNIVHFIGGHEADSVRCIVTEYLNGGNVRQYLSKQKQGLQLNTVLRMAMDVAQGMEFLHSHDVIHRDLKSENLALDSLGNVKVMDFGLAKFASSCAEMTAEMGTYRWMAPEVIKGDPYGPSADVYSFGIVLWELWTRELPFEGMTPVQAAFAVAFKSARPHIPAGCPRFFAQLMQSCWQTNPERRPTFSTIVKSLMQMHKGVPMCVQM